MKENYTVPEIEVIKFNTEDTILMSGKDNDSDLGDIGWGVVPD